MSGETLEGALLTFLDPVPGLEPLTRFALSPVEDCPDLFTLRSVDAPKTRLFLVDPTAFFPDYRPEVDESVLERVAADGADPVVLVVLRPASGEAPHTANLLAPILVNPETGAALQAVLDDDTWPLRAPLVPAA